MMPPRDAALIARALPGRPVRVQWMREQEHAWEPYRSRDGRRRSAPRSTRAATSSTGITTCGATRIRRGRAGRRSARGAQSVGSRSRRRRRKPIPQPEGGGDRNAIPLYTIPERAGGASFHSRHAAAGVRAARARRLHERLLHRELHGRAGAGARQRPGRIPSRASRRRARARRGIRRPRERIRLAACSQLPRARPRLRLRALQEFRGLLRGRGRGRGRARNRRVASFACGRRGRQRPSGQPGRNQKIRSRAASSSRSSWTLYERGDLRRHTDHQPRLVDLSDPALSMPCPDSVEVHIIDRPGQPFLGTGEAAQGPAAAAIANAIANATGRGCAICR